MSDVKKYTKNFLYIPYTIRKSLLFVYSLYKYIQSFVETQNKRKRKIPRRSNHI